MWHSFVCFNVYNQEQVHLCVPNIFNPCPSVRRNDFHSSSAIYTIITQITCSRVVFLLTNPGQSHSIIAHGLLSSWSAILHWKYIKHDILSIYIIYYTYNHNVIAIVICLSNDLCHQLPQMYLDRFGNSDIFNELKSVCSKMFGVPWCEPLILLRTNILTFNITNWILSCQRCITVHILIWCWQNSTHRSVA